MSEFDSELVAIKDIHPNPYRELATYGLISSKVAELQASIHDTGFWPNVIGRRNSQGQVEIAYGHHRLQAATLEFGPDHMLPIHIQNLDDHAMLQIMAAENSDDWANPQQHVRMCITSAIKELEKSLDTGKMWSGLEDKAAKDAFDNADSFREALEVGPSPTDVARYLGKAWTSTVGKGKFVVAGFRVRQSWHLLNKTDRMKNGLRLKIQETEDVRLKNVQRAKNFPQRDEGKVAKIVAMEAERKAQKMRVELEHDEKWDDTILDNFSQPKQAQAFKEGMLDSESGQIFLEETGGDWKKALETVEKVTGEEKGKALSTDKEGQINDSKMKIKTEAAMDVAVDKALNAAEDDRREAYELMTILDKARAATKAAGSSIHRCTNHIARHGMHERAGLNLRLVLGEIAGLQVAADRLHKATQNIDLEAIVEGNVYENDDVEGEI